MITLHARMDSSASSAMALVGALAVAAVAAVVDARTGRLPNRLVGLVAGAGLLAAIMAPLPGPGLLAASAGAAGFAGPLLLTHLAAPRAIGFGDVKFAAALGLVIGRLDPRSGVFALCVATGVTAFVGLATRRDTVPLGPGLATGAVVTALLAGSVGA